MNLGDNSMCINLMFTWNQNLLGQDCDAKVGKGHQAIEIFLRRWGWRLSWEIRGMQLFPCFPQRLDEHKEPEELLFDFFLTWPKCFFTIRLGIITTTLTS